MSESSTLDCQDCGIILRELNASETQQVADNPYNYVVYCSYCKRDEERKIRREAIAEG